VIYFVKPEDTLWRIAKKLKSTTEDIQRVNDLEDDSRVVQGQQLYIPKLSVNSTPIRLLFWAELSHLYGDLSIMIIGLTNFCRLF
jgi:LysM repeat protein